ncbi:MAG: polysaccharide lyase [Phycisphaerales bacterium]|nr:MAG: polysaccharide lyase [Phycisphaerales bacterium]
MTGRRNAQAMAGGRRGLAAPKSVGTAAAVLLCLLSLSLDDPGALAGQGANRAKPIQLHPDNPHYFLWRGKPTILITSGEHYGAVLNRAFGCKKYLKALGSHGFNLTRTFSGAYCEPPGAFNIRDNTLAPAKGQLICPWARSSVPGYPNGGNKFDLSKWDPAYFKRLRDFVAEAGKQGVVVELVLFCPFYEDWMWKLSPMNATNNVNGIGQIGRTEAYTLKYPKLQAAQDEMVRRIVAELKDFDNLYYEICNEPYFGGVTMPWQHHIAEGIARAEAGFKNKHLIAQNIANKGKKIADPNPHVSIFNFHYAKPPDTVAENYGLNKALGDDETGFAGMEPAPYRREAWDFLIAGGGVFDNLDFSFTVGHEDGTAEFNAPGTGGAEMHKQLEILIDFMNGLDFVRMKPDNSVIKGGVPEKATARALVEPGRAYAVYINGGNKADLVLQLPKGRYRAEWVNTKTGKVDKKESFDHSGGNRTLRGPDYVDDIALRIRSREETKHGLTFRGDFETGSLEGWRTSGNPPAVCSSPTRAGAYAMKTSLDRRKDKVAYRTEVSGPASQIGKEYWYGFSILLPEDYVPDNIWEIVAQWHGVPDFDIGENWRNPVMALSTTGGKWGFVSRWDSKRNTFEGGKRSYGGTKQYDLGAYATGVWTDWVVHVKWSHGSDGILGVWKNGQKVVTQGGPNAFNDKKGPYFKMGLYKGWKDPKRQSDAVSSRVLYHDEFRMAEGASRYEDVAPAK